jgi:hypothetical protein
MVRIFRSSFCLVFPHLNGPDIQVSDIHKLLGISGRPKLHNGKLDPTTAGIDEPEWWTRAFFVIDIGIVSNHQSHFDTNRVSLRYIEPVKTLDMSSYTIPGLGKGPEQVEILQHEHALVTVNADCKMIEWDQYGDNTEQEQVGVAVNATLPYLPLYLACVQGPNAESCASSLANMHRCAHTSGLPIV